MLVAALLGWLAPTPKFPPPRPALARSRLPRAPPPTAQLPNLFGKKEVVLEAVLDDEKTAQLFAWIARALQGEPEYNNLISAFQAIFGERPTARLIGLRDAAVAAAPAEDAPVGDPIGLMEREQMSLGAMGAGQWTGRWRTRPHALLDVRGFSDVDEWAKSLPRGARRTLAKSLAQNFTVTSKVIDGDAPAPHSSLAHFRCVVEHEARLLAKSPDAFFEALQVAISRYMGTTQQAGVIREYRDAETGRVLAFAHEVQKGRCMRGQWFYGTDAASKRYVWFHSVHELVRRAIESDGVDHADLGPSGSDSFTELKERYGFESVEDWHLVADYSGGFRHGDVESEFLWP